MLRPLDLAHSIGRRCQAGFTDSLESIGTTFDDETSAAADAVERPAPLFMSP